MAKFKTRHPQIEINLQTGNDQTLSQMVIDQEIEIGIVNAPLASPCLSIVPYRREKFVLFACPDHPLTRKGTMNLKDIARTPLIVPHPGHTAGTTEQFLRAFASRGLKLHIAMRCESPAVVKEVVRRKIGVGVLF